MQSNKSDTSWKPVGDYAPQPDPSWARQLWHRIWAYLRRTAADFRAYLAVIFDADAPPKQRWTHAAYVTTGGGMGLFAFFLLALVTYALVLYPSTPGVDDLRAARTARPTVVYAAGGETLTEYTQVNRDWVTLDEVSPVVLDALIATEDHRFYRHDGLDLHRTLGAAWLTLTGDTQGGSTLTQQLARNLFPHEIGRAVAVDRKLKEMITARKIERLYTKDEILEVYLNTVPFLYNATGIEMAAQTYFGKSAAVLDTLEAATLVGMLKGTAFYNPVRNPERAVSRRNVVLGQMVRYGTLTSADYDTLKTHPLALDFAPQSMRLQSKAPHFTEHVRGWLIDWAERHGYNIYRDGLVVHTTLDLPMQEAVTETARRYGDALQAVADVEWSRRSRPWHGSQPERYVGETSRPFGHFWATERSLVDDYVRATPAYEAAVKSGHTEAAALNSLRADAVFMDSLRAARTRLEVSVTALDPRNGHVKVWVGSRDFAVSEYDRVAQAKRQPGSTFKPFVYAAALERGYSPYETFVDEAVEIQVGRNQVWRPTNSDGVSGEPVFLRDGLVRSKNTITAQLINQVGARRVAGLAQRMGVESELEAVPSLALGTSDVTLLEMTRAYATIANEGTRRVPVWVTRIEDRTGRVIASFGSASEPALARHTARTLLDMMRGVVDEGTGRGIRTRYGIEADVAGKTGTTQHGADGWFLMMHPELVAGAWVGFDDPRVRFRSSYWGQGAHNALLLVGDFFRTALRDGFIDAEATFLAPRLQPPPPEEDDWLDRWFADRDGQTDLAPGDSLYRVGSVTDAEAAFRQLTSNPAEAGEAPDRPTAETRPSRVIDIAPVKPKAPDAIPKAAPQTTRPQRADRGTRPRR